MDIINIHSAIRKTHVSCSSFPVYRSPFVVPCWLLPVRCSPSVVLHLLSPVGCIPLPWAAGASPRNGHVFATAAVGSACSSKRRSSDGGGQQGCTVVVSFPVPRSLFVVSLQMFTVGRSPTVVPNGSFPLGRFQSVVPCFVPLWYPS